MLQQCHEKAHATMHVLQIGIDLFVPPTHFCFCVEYLTYIVNRSENESTCPICYVRLSAEVSASSWS